jgi:hypothetical protein
MLVCILRWYSKAEISNLIDSTFVEDIGWLDIPMQIPCPKYIHVASDDLFSDLNCFVVGELFALFQ